MSTLVRTQLAYLREQIAHAGAVQKRHKATYVGVVHGSPEQDTLWAAFEVEFGTKKTFGSSTFYQVEDIYSRKARISALLDLHRGIRGKEPCHGTKPELVAQYMNDWLPKQLDEPEVPV